MKHIYVLGSNSFSGSHFVSYALNAGYRVTGISRSQEALDVFLPYRWKTQKNLQNFEFIQADINTDLAIIMKHLRAHQPNYVVNFMAQGMVAESWQNPVHWFNTNTVAQVNLHDALRSCTWLEKYVHVSTPEVYGSTQGLVKENTQYMPSTPYAVSKAAADMSLMSFAHAYDFPVVFTRAANVYGPGQLLYRIIPRAALRFLTGGTLELHGGGHSVRSFIHMQDVADATLRIMTEGQPRSIYHIATKESISIKKLVFLVAKEAGIDAEKHIKIVGDRLGKDAAYCLDTEKLRTELTWNDTITLEEGIKDTLHWVRENLSILQNQTQDYIHKV